MSHHVDAFGGAPEEFPPGYAEFEIHRARYLDERRRDTEQRCADELLRELVTELTAEGCSLDVET